MRCRTACRSKSGFLVVLRPARSGASADIPHRVKPFFPPLQSQEMDIELDILSLILLAVIVILLIIPVVVPSDPDTFPFIINNQSQPSKVRHPKESAIYRHRDQPHGYPLITGLSLRKGYEAPRDGDLRDVWEIALQKDVTIGIVRGGKCEFEKLSSRKDELNKLGSGLREIAGEHGKVAIYLPNTIENLLTSFACAFYGLTSVILPFTTSSHNPPTIPDDVIDILKIAKPDVLILPAGLAIQDLKEVKSIKGIVVVDISSAPHIDWTTETGGVPVQTWTDLLESEAHHEPSEPAPVAIQSFIPSKKNFKAVDFTQQNVIAAIASQLKLLPKDHVLSENDVVLPLAPFSDTISRTITFASLASGSTLLLHPLTDAPAQESLSRQLHPTVVVADYQIANLLNQTVLGWRRESTLSSIKLTLNQGKLTSGRLPVGLNVVRKSISTKLRLLYFTVQPHSRPVFSYHLDLLRAGLGSHIVYAFGSPMAFGPIAQTHIHDYRTDSSADSGYGHFGAPIGGVELKISGISDEGSVHGKVGSLEMTGPIVAAKGWVHTGVKAKWRRDGCLEVAF